MLVARNSNVAQPNIIEWPPTQTEDTNTMGVGHVKTGCSCTRAANSFFVTLPDGPVRPLSMFYTCPINFRRFASPTPTPPFSTPATDMLNWPRTQPNLKKRSSRYLWGINKPRGARTHCFVQRLAIPVPDGQP
ncbi:hypothetical protein RSOLAG22IIIB_10207 [Rhizoctonia solani]|uniref:Uncharacterized protein n=1 Tax=Rhizoctonia solani TaxID=456999 RepID=A0A0K6G293_9AGAM|nr:hypothetical protein RSOLAG22IIIB_10207 [Rhizoctonia solani]